MLGITDRGWARFFARVMLGFIFLMAGWFKCFDMTPLGHARALFTEPYADTWIPYFLLLITGTAVPILELLAGLALIVGFRTREALLVIGAILLLVTYGHLLKEPLFATNEHIFPRTILMLVTFYLPAAEDKLTLDSWLSRPKPA